MEIFAKNGDEHNLEETELRLGLPGAIDSDSGGGQRSSGKRGFSEAMECRSNSKWAFTTALTPARVNELEACKPNHQGKFLASPTAQNMMQCHATTWQAGGQDSSVQSSPYVSSRSPLTQTSGLIGSPTEPMKMSNESHISSSDSDGMAPAPKARVVGWPPIRSFRKNTLAANPKSGEDSEKAWNGVYVKVSMDGAPYLRKVDLKTYSSYQDLSTALQNMFGCFTIGKYGCGRESLSESKLMDVVNGSEYVPTYEDKDGDWMLVGDVPWNMFVDSCKRLRIMKGSEAIGLAPRAMEKCKTRN